MTKLLQRLFGRRRRLTPHQRGAQTRKANWLAKSAAHRAAILASMQTEAGR